MIDGSDLDIGDGGSASFQDVCRVLWALWSDNESPSKAALIPAGELQLEHSASPGSGVTSLGILHRPGN